MKASYARLKRPFELQTIVRGKIMAPLKNRQSHRPPAVGRRGAGSAGAHHVEAVGGGFGRFLLYCKASAVLSTPGARIMSYSEKRFTWKQFCPIGAGNLASAHTSRGLAMWDGAENW
jgi:hypothetical protein